MTTVELAKHGQELIRIMEESDERLPLLQKLASKVGASIKITEKGMEGGPRTDASEDQLCNNIHKALQTATMVIMCERITAISQGITAISNRQPSPSSRHP